MIVCKKQTTDLQQGIQNLIDTMVEDYARWAKSLDWEDSKSTEFADKISTMSMGPEYTSSFSFPKHPPITDEISSNIVIAVTDFREFIIFFKTLY